MEATTSHIATAHPLWPAARATVWLGLLGMAGTAFAQQPVDDAADTALVRSNLLANASTRGLSIEVTTEDAVVTLRGRVPSRKAKMLAEMIARNTDGVAGVRSQLEINEQTQQPTRRVYLYESHQ